MIAFYPHVRIEKYVVMPNHIHLLIAIQQGPSGASRTPPPTSARASQVIPMFISTLKRLTNKTAGHALWQRGYYDHIIRSPDDYSTIWHYIDTNPAKWAQDTRYVTDFPDPVRQPGCCTNKEVTQMSRYFTKTLAALEPYTPGEQLKLPDLVKLNANENPYPPAPGVAAAVAGAVPGLRLYSDLTEAALCAAIARHCGVQPENILCGNGSDENLLLALRAFCDETHPLAFADITYSFYPVLCDLLHIPQHVILVEEDFSLDLSKYHGLNETIVIANPNAPTTLLQPVAAIEEVVRTNPDSIVIVDEAYIDFAGPNASCVPLTKKYDNVIVVQTFSKSHNLAGARVGFCVANPELIADMNRIKFSYSPYNVKSLSQAAAVAAINAPDRSGISVLRPEAQILRGQQVVGPFRAFCAQHLLQRPGPGGGKGQARIGITAQSRRKSRGVQRVGHGPERRHPAALAAKAQRIHNAGSQQSLHSAPGKPLR